MFKTPEFHKDPMATVAQRKTPKTKKAPIGKGKGTKAAMLGSSGESGKPEGTSCRCDEQADT